MAERYDEELFLGYLEGELTPERAAQFEKLMTEDARLRNLVAQLVQDRHQLRQLPRERAPEEIMERVNQRLERRMLLDTAPRNPAAETAPIRRFRLNRILAYGGMAALVVVGVSVIGYSLFNRKIQSMASGSLSEPGAAVNQSAAPSSAPPMAGGGGSSADAASPGPASGANAMAATAAPSSPKPFRARGIMIADDTLDPPPPSDSLINDIVTRMMGMPRPVLGVPSLIPPGETRMTAVAKAAIPELDELLGDSSQNTGNAKVPPSDVGVLMDTAHPDVSEEALRYWAMQNDVRVLSAEQNIDMETLDPAVAKDVKAQTTHVRRLTLLMTASQLPDLIKQMKRYAQQSVRKLPLSTGSQAALKKRFAGSVERAQISAQPSASMQSITSSPRDIEQEDYPSAVPVYIVPQETKPSRDAQP